MQVQDVNWDLDITQIWQQESQNLVPILFKEYIEKQITTRPSLPGRSGEGGSNFSLFSFQGQCMCEKRKQASRFGFGKRSQFIEWLKYNLYAMSTRLILSDFDGAICRGVVWMNRKFLLSQKQDRCAGRNTEYPELGE